MKQERKNRKEEAKVMGIKKAGNRNERSKIMETGEEETRGEEIERRKQERKK
jgi:hypothetical protein